MSCSCSGGPAAHEDDCEGSSLLPFIDTPRLTCGNEREAGSAVRVFRTLAARRDAGGTAGLLRSHAGDPELLLHIPFTTPCRVKSVCIAGPDAGHPPLVRVFANRDDLDFATVADAVPDQTLTLPADATADAWLPLKQVKFGSATSVTLHFPADGAAHLDYLELCFVGLKGVASGLKRGAVTAVYEARAQLSDHSVKNEAGAGRMGL